jgi:uncharacterized protein YdaU (DUF1376 family)
MKSPAFQFYPADYTSSQRVRLLTLEEEGAYINLLCSCWLHGSIPADPDMAARLVGKGCSATLATTVLTMFTPSSEAGRMVHERLERERLKQSDWREKSASGGRKSAELRKGASTTVQPPLANGINQKATLQSSVSSLQSSSTSTSSAPTHTAPVPVAVVEPADCPFPPEVTKAARARNVLLDSLAACGGADPLQIVASAWSGIGKALADIKGVCPQVTPEEIARRSANYRTHMSDKTILTHSALAKNWALCDKPNPRNKPAQESEFADAFDPDFQQHLHRINKTQ